MAICQSCGEQVDDTSKFCKKCGATLVVATVQTNVQPAAAPQQPAPVSNYNGGVRVSNGCITWPNNTISISHLEKISTSSPKPPFPKAALVVLVLALVFFVVNPLIALVLLIASIAWIVFWAVKKSNSPKGITFYMNSGNMTSISLSDQAAVDAVVACIRQVMNGESIDYFANCAVSKTESESASKGIFG